MKEKTESGRKKIITQKKVTLTPVVFKGKGLSKEFCGLSWNTIREAAYKKV